MLYDTVRGAGSTKSLESNVTLAEGGGNQATYGYLSAFDSDGFTTTDGSGTPNYYFNENTKDFVAWNWKAGGTAASNTDGTITSSVSANTTAGFSIVSYTGTGTTAQTVGHGLSVAPEMIIIKSRSLDHVWNVFNSPASVTGNTILQLQSSAAAVTGGNIEIAANTSTFGIGSATQVNTSLATFIAYCFHSVEGYSKIGTYVSNNNADGPFLHLGFTPAFIMLKCFNATDNWNIYDNKRNGYNGTGGTYQLRADTTAASFTSAATMVDLVSNGMKIRTNDPGTNGSGRNYIYYAVAESPFKTSNTR
jgi:hypothetical protein